MAAGPTAHHHATWLCPDPAARERLLDMDARLQKPRAAAIGILALVLLGSSFELGLWPIPLIVVASLGFLLATRVQARLQAPELAIATSWAFAQTIIAFAVGMTGGAESFGMSWLLILLVTLPARFGVRGVAAGVLFTSTLIATVVSVAPRGTDMPDVYGIVFPIAALVAVAMLSTALLRSDLEHRTEAIIDGLTGMLNRRALGHRLEELRAQAEVTGEPVAVITGDIDHFKHVNDEHGHATGDAVLVDVAYRLRKRLRAFDLAYRLGGEEFLIVLPGATLGDASAMAEDLRSAIAGAPVGGLAVTMSFGVAGSGGDGFDGDAVLAAADEALYAAKAAGRDRVVTAGAEPAVV